MLKRTNSPLNYRYFRSLKSFASLPQEHDQSDETGNTDGQPKVAPSKNSRIDHGRANGGEGRNQSRQSGQYESSHDGLLSGYRIGEHYNSSARAMSPGDLTRLNVCSGRRAYFAIETYVNQKIYIIYMYARTSIKQYINCMFY